MTGDDESRPWNRRQFLAMAGATAGAGLLAGCSEVTSQEFIADGVVLPQAAQTDLGFSALVEKRDRREYSRSIAGRDVAATIESTISVYAENETGGAVGTSEAALLVRFVGGDGQPFGAAGEKRVALASAFNVSGGQVPFLQEPSDGYHTVDATGIVLFAPQGTEEAVDPEQTLSLFHRSAIDGDSPFRLTQDSVVFPGGAFFPAGEEFPDKSADVAYVPGPGVDAEAVGPSGTGKTMLEAGEELDADYVAAPASVLLDTNVDIDLEWLADDIGVAELGVSDPEGLSPGVVLLTDGDVERPWVYVAGDELFPGDSSYPDSVFTEGDLARGAGSERLLSAPLREVFPDEAFVPEEGFVPSYGEDVTVLLPVSAEVLEDVPEPFSVAGADDGLDPAETVLFTPAINLVTADLLIGNKLPDDFDYPDSFREPRSSLFSVSGPGLGLPTVPAAGGGLPDSFPNRVLDLAERNAPTHVLHFPGAFEFPASTFDSAGATVTGATGSVGNLDAASVSGGQLTVGVLSTPAARAAGQTLNPLARMGLADLLTSDQAEGFLNSSGVGGGGSVEWVRGPERLSTAEGTMLGQDVTVETHAGVVSGETPNATYLHMARTETGDSVVIATGLASFDVEDTSKALVGPDGYLTESELEAARSTVVDVDAALVVE